ncbi:MAG: class I SAM-dependent methyltransferase [Candidatus Solibacter usitatus]|nr:class I SAM-dependent methyltransferase [Candidatus Solibacter usitatus]
MATGTMPAGGPSSALIFDLLTSHARTSALCAAIELDLFRAVGAGPADASTLAQRIGASVRGTRILCDFLTIQGLLVKDGSIYSHSETSAAFLDPRSPRSLASTARFLSNPMLTEPYQHLAGIVRQGRTVLPGQGSVEPENPAWVEFTHSMAPMMAPVAGPLGQIVLEGRKGPMNVLDIAAGHGLFGIEIAKQNPQARVTALDWAPVLAVASENARKAGVEARFSTLAGSAFDVDYGGPYDAILLTNFLHHFDAATCVGLLKKVRAALKPGGLSATLEFVPNEDRVSPPMAAAFSMTMLITTESGDAYTFSELNAMHREAGFNDIQAHPVPMSPHTVVTARA